MFVHYSLSIPIYDRITIVGVSNVVILIVVKPFLIPKLWNPLLRFRHVTS